MKKILIGIIKIYQKIPGSWHGYCKHIPTCSEYMKQAIEIHGSIKGIALGTKRILKCNPLGTFGYDPVPKKEKKMKKKLFGFIFILLGIFCLSGCDTSGTNTMVVYTSVYPVEYILENLYGSNIAIYSIYPDGSNYANYNLTKKQLTDYSKGDLYIYNGTIKKEKDYAVEMINSNKKIKIIDASQGMDYTYNVSETWLDPSNYLMMASNIRKGLKEYISIEVENNKIDKNYNKLKLSLSEVDAELKSVANNANNSILVVSNDCFKFLEKYGFTVISLQEGENLTDKVIADATKLASNKMIQYIFIKDNEEINSTVKEIADTYGITITSLNSLATISATERKDKNDYLSIMEENINSIKLEVNN